MQAPHKLLISIVTPCRNEAVNLKSHFERTRNAIAPFRESYEFEHIYTDNDSADDTFAILRALAHEFASVRVLRFSRNIGPERAMMLGLEHAKGEAAILIQADLQDPPELIPAFIRGWEEGHDVVYGKSERRQERGILRLLQWAYYRIVARLSDIPIPEDAGDFRLTSRRVLEALSRYQEYDLYIRGAISHIGFSQKAISYQRSKRAGGRSNSRLSYLFGFALNGIVSSSVAPIRAVILLGILTSIAGFLATAGYVLSKLIFPGSAPHGFTTLISVITLFSGLQMFSLGIIGEYIRKIYVESLGRPRGFVRDKINFN